ncbi:MAG: hypothetical protein AAGH67_16045 [Cyanobacteria bacterium P01_H01_bin.162]
MTPGVDDFKFLTAPVEVFGDGQNFILKGTSVKLLWKIGRWLGAIGVSTNRLQTPLKFADLDTAEWSRLPVKIVGVAFNQAASKVTV